MAILYLVILVGIYIFLYLQNSQIEEPEECRSARVACHSCQDFSCLAHPTFREKKEEEEK